MKKIILFSLCVLSASVFAAKNIKPMQFNTAIKKAIKEKKPLILSVHRESCKWCHVMDKKTFGNSEIIKFIKKNFILARMDSADRNYTYIYEGKKYSLGEFAASLGVRGTPTTAFFNNKGKLLSVIPGFIPPNIFIKILSYIRLSCYEKNISFQDFMKKPKTCSTGKK